jgi:hypothetical protein
LVLTIFENKERKYEKIILIDYYILTN